MSRIIPFFFFSRFQKIITFFCCLFLLAGVATALAQPITGVWRGRITKGSGLRQQSAPIEIKFVAQGDSIVGTSYYYGSGKSHVRYSIKGYFGKEYNTVIWQDYHLVEVYPEKPKQGQTYKETMKMEADYSCPDGKTLRLDGIGRLPGEPDFKVELKKMDNTFFPDEWDEVIGGYFVGMARKDVVDSVWAIASEPFIGRDVVSRASGDVAVAENKVPGRENANLSSRPPTEVKANPVVPSTAAAVPEKMPDTLAIAKVETPVNETVKAPEKQQDPKVDSGVTAKAVMPPVNGEITNSGSGTTAGATGAVSNKPPPPPSVPQDITAQMAEQQRRQSASNPPVNPDKPVTETAKPEPGKTPPVTQTATTATATAKTTAVGVVVAAPENAIENPVMKTAFSSRRKVVQSELPILGDTIELRFYDNAEVDGDSISLFLNGVALFQHVRLDARPYVFKLPLKGLPDINELAMVAENLGAIPPNTAFMEAFVQGQRYSARLESTENTSAVIRLVKKE